ncbi:NAD-dependent epimerase/dehydratase family protein [Phaeobacter sp. 22II1-1F12B]|uniref:NAD-dependent epimerase/dehydratase family protein n=1 Tax=Phaeobacter sp. 22II1-1F12B TaxID=1317111 RepID=UPI000B526F1D|nr:NAD-dependent epimerase/dehydratase family protein [Phaeobacter sp. 22II1-1F12B]OWU82652.1 hypothetical protein ATO1_01710 [Phaeobacter sp. 22II1-1F12B]
MRRAVVLGGGGHFGAALCAGLLERGWNVTAVTRTGGRRAGLQKLSVKRVICDDGATGAMRHLVRGHELIIDAAAPYALDLHDGRQSHSQRLAAAKDRMASLIFAARANGSVLVYIGSFLTRYLMSEEYDRRLRIISASHPYFRMKLELERLAKKAAKRGDPIIIVNPTSLLGPGNLRIVEHCFVASVLHGKMPASFPDIINVMDVRDAAEATLRTLDAGIFGMPIWLSGHNISVHDLTEMIAKLGRVECPPRWRGLAMGAAVLYALENGMSVLGRGSRFPSLPVLLTLASRAVDQSSCQRALGVDLRPLETTIRDEIGWYRSRDLT